VIDFIIALTAVRHDMSVLHDDRDFATIAKHGGIGFMQHNVGDDPPAP
jgi:predicted nucleic acid-binding protein